MARILIADDDYTPYVEITTDVEGRTTAVCAECRWESGARPHDPIADHLQEAIIHIDLGHNER